MSNKKMASDGFEMDERGVIRIVPLTIPEFLRAPSEKKLGKTSPVLRRKYIPIDRLKLTPADFEDVPQNREQPQKESNVRKKLFKVPSKKITVPVRAVSRRISSGQTASRRSNASVMPAVPYTRKRDTKTSSPLILIDAAEELFERKDQQRRLNYMCSFQSDQKNTNTSERRDSVSEFVETERSLGVQPNTASHDNAAVKEILHILKEQQDQINSFIEKQQENGRRIAKLLTQLQIREDNKENDNPQNNNKKDNSNLRKTVLSKTIENNVHHDVKTQKAFEMYNALKGNTTILCTPRACNSFTDSPSTNAKISLSKIIQKQCLLLQETPLKK